MAQLCSSGLLAGKAERTRSRLFRKARLCLLAVSALVASVIVSVEHGALRRPAPIRDAPPGSVILRPEKTLIERHGDGDYHYGLIFKAPLPKGVVRITQHSLLDTRLCDRGPVQRWQCWARGADGQSVEIVVFLPRSWLVLQGFLPLRAAFTAFQPHRLRDEEVLLKSFWLEERK